MCSLLVLVSETACGWHGGVAFELTRDAGTTGLLIAQGLKKVGQTKYENIISLTPSNTEWRGIHHL